MILLKHSKIQQKNNSTAGLCENVKGKSVVLVPKNECYTLVTHSNTRNKCNTQKYVYNVKHSNTRKKNKTQQYAYNETHSNMCKNVTHSNTCNNVTHSNTRN